MSALVNDNARLCSLHRKSEYEDQPEQRKLSHLCCVPYLDPTSAFSHEGMRDFKFPRSPDLASSSRSCRYPAFEERLSWPVVERTSDSCTCMD
jgi:hypothetical protein